MAFYCPKCTRQPLTFKGQDGGGHRCPACDGLWIPQDQVPRWREFGGQSALPNSEHAEADERTGPCPEGHGILTRARVETDHKFYIERCGHCRGVWFDKGEWHRLAAVTFLDGIGDLWDPLWRANRRSAHSQEQLDQSLAEALGEDTFERLRLCMDALASHPARAQAIAWIDRRLRKR